MGLELEDMQCGIGLFSWDSQVRLDLFSPQKGGISSFPPHPGLWTLKGATFESPGTGQILGWPELWGEIKMSKSLGHTPQILA